MKKYISIIIIILMIGIGSAQNYMPEFSMEPGAGIEMDATTPGNIEMWGGAIKNATMGDTLPYNLVGTSQHCDYVVDGISDQIEINNAIAAGKPIQLEPGVTFHIDGKILLSNDTDICGNRAIISREMNDTAIYAEGKTNITLRDMIVIANDDVFSLDYQHPIFITNSSYIWLDRILVYGAPNNANGICIGSQNGAIDAEENLCSFVWVTRSGAFNCKGDSLYYFNIDYGVVDSFISDGSNICAVDFFGCNYISASGITARGGALNNYLVNVDKCRQSTFEVVVDCNNTGYPGIYVTHGDGNIISGSINNVLPSDKSAIILGESNNTTVCDMSIRGGKIDIHGGDRNVIDNVIIQTYGQCTAGISVSASATNTAIRGTCIIDPTTYGIYSDSCAITVDACEIRGATYGIYLAGTAAGGASYSKIRGCRIDKSGTHGIYGLDNHADNANLYVAVLGNIITNSGTNSINTAGNSDYWLLDGNIFGGDATSMSGSHNVIGDNIA